MLEGSIGCFVFGGEKELQLASLTYWFFWNKQFTPYRNYFQQNFLWRLQSWVIFYLSSIHCNGLQWQLLSCQSTKCPRFAHCRADQPRLGRYQKCRPWCPPKRPGFTIRPLTAKKSSKLERGCIRRSTRRVSNKHTKADLTMAPLLLLSDNAIL